MMIVCAVKADFMYTINWRRGTGVPPILVLDQLQFSLSKQPNLQERFITKIKLNN